MKTFKEFKLLSEKVKTVGPLWQRDMKVFPLNPGKWKTEWKKKYNVEFVKIEKIKKFKEIHIHVYVKGEEEDLANWFVKEYFIKKHGFKPTKYPEALEFVKDADDDPERSRVSFTIN